MKQTIRFNTFETNSSSTHSCIIVPDKYWNDWCNGKIAFIESTYDSMAKELKEKHPDRFVPVDEIKQHPYYLEKCPNPENYEEEYEYEEALEAFEYEISEDVFTADQWDNRYEYLEEDETVYTTENGDKIHICCKYGYDG